MNIAYRKAENRRRKELLTQLRACEDNAVKAHLKAELKALRDKILQREAKKSFEKSRKNAQTAQSTKPSLDVLTLSDVALRNKFACQRDFVINMGITSNSELLANLEAEVVRRKLPLVWKDGDSYVDQHGVPVQNFAERVFMGTFPKGGDNA